MKRPAHFGIAGSGGLEGAVVNRLLWRLGYALVPIEPTDAMLRTACPDGHEPGVNLGRPGGLEQGECVYIERRRRIWRDMLEAAK